MRLALIVDAADDIDSFVTLLNGVEEELVAVLVPPTEYEMARSVVGMSVRCVTHPNELATAAVDVCVAWHGQAVLRRHGHALPKTVSVREFWSTHRHCPTG